MVAWRMMPVYHTWLTPIEAMSFSTFGVKSFILPLPFSAIVPLAFRVVFRLP